MGYLRKLFRQKRRNKQLSNKKVFCANIISCVTILTLVLMYFLQVNTTVYKNYSIRDAEKQIADLNEEYKSLELEIINLQSIHNLTNRAEELELISSENVEYITLNSSYVAKK